MMEPAATPEPPTDPLPTLIWSRQQDHRLQKVGPSSLAVISRFGPILHLSGVAWFVLLAIVFAGIALGEYNHKLGGALWVACGLCTVAAVVVLILPRFLGPFWVQARFDRASNTLDLARSGLTPRQRRDLDAIESVQLLSVGTRSDDTGPFPSFQLNLVLRGHPPERLHVVENGSPDSLRRMADTIAAFLHVPLVEQAATVPVDALPAEPPA